MASITATVLASSLVPQPVQLVLSDIPTGDSYQVVGIGTGGRTWPVAGGTGTSQGVQIVLIDNRSPVNQPVRYRLTTPAGTVQSGQVTVPWEPDGASAKFLVQSLDGRTVVPIKVWQDNQLPRDPVVHATAFEVRGRRRPVMALTVAGEGAMPVVWRLDRAASTKLNAIVAAGGGVVIRTDGTARDLPLSDTAVITGAPNQLWEGDNGISTDRVWSVELTWIDDPEPSTIPVVYSVDQVDALLAGDTVDDVDALFAALTVDAVDALDWGQVTP